MSQRSQYAQLVYDALLVAPGETTPRTQDELRMLTKLNEARVGRGIAELLLDEGAIASSVRSERFEVVREYYIVRFDEEEEQQSNAA